MPEPDVVWLFTIRFGTLDTACVSLLSFDTCVIDCSSSRDTYVFPV